MPNTRDTAFVQLPIAIDVRVGELTSLDKKHANTKQKHGHQ